MAVPLLGDHAAGLDLGLQVGAGYQLVPPARRDPLGDIDHGHGDFLGPVRPVRRYGKPPALEDNVVAGSPLAPRRPPPSSRAGQPWSPPP